MSIRAIDKTTVHKICSGQVIVDLASAVKELVENSLDAGATVVEVKLKNMGVDSIEVSDNGVGVEPCNYEGIAMKHHTSKLDNFSDVYTVDSFGFRGEALNALCELSDKFSVTTRQVSQTTATLLSFDSIGRVISKQIVPRSVGTSVVVEGLFGKLPVRRGELVRSGKKQYLKMLKIIQSYALISVGIQIVITNVNNGAKQSVLATQAGTKSLLDTTSILFGSVFASSLIPISCSVTIDANALAVIDKELSENKEQNISDNSVDKVESNVEKLCDSVAVTDEKAVVTLSGYVSKVGVGVGRSDNDRQFIFCNGRPVDNHRINRVANEVWRRYEMKQKPAFIFDIRIPVGYFDVNVTPDKREVFIVQEAELLEQLRIALDTLYEPSRYTLGAITLSSASNSSTTSSGVAAPTLRQQTIQLSQSSTRSDLSTESNAAPSPSVRPHTSSTVSSQGSLTKPIMAASLSSSSTRDNCVSFSSNSHTSSGANRSGYGSVGGSVTSSVRETVWTSVPTPSPTPNVETTFPIAETTVPIDRKVLVSLDNAPKSKATSGPVIEDLTQEETNQQSNMFSMDIVEDSVREDIVSNSRPNRDTFDDSVEATSSNNSSSVIGNSDYIQGTNYTNVVKVDVDKILKGVKSNARLWSNDLAATEDIICEYKRRRESSTTNESSNNSSSTNNNTENLEDNVNAMNSISDNTMSRRLTKQDFPRMRIIGQFNVGFVIVELDGDLFIVDPHACDEKFRFENLQRSTKIHQQPLISPLVLQTSIAQEIIIMDNLDIFEENGFKLQVNSTDEGTANAGKRVGRVSLLAVPFSKSIQFGVDDVNELASMIGEDSYNCDSNSNNMDQGGYNSSSSKHTTDDRMSKNYLMLKNDAVTKNNSMELTSSSRKKYRLPKLVALFASRACRSAVMLGTGLSHNEMKNIVSQMETVEQPWNCPHGRPTMRHLFDLSQLSPQK